MGNIWKGNFYNKIVLSILLISSFNSYCQENIKIYINGIWNISGDDDSYLIYNDGKEYFISKKDKKIDDSTYNSYFIMDVDSSFRNGNYTDYYPLKKDDLFKKNSLSFKNDYLDIMIVFLAKEELKDDINDYSKIYLSLKKDKFNTIEINNGKQYPNIDFYNRTNTAPRIIYDFYKRIAKDRFFVINKKQSTIHKSINIPSSIYILKGDEIEILEEKDEWLRVRFYGKKIVEGWIKKSDVDKN